MATTIKEVRFVVDENLLRLGAALGALRADVACFGHEPVAGLLPAGILDTDWIPLVGARRWIAITTDKRLRTRPAQAHLAIHHRLKVIHLFGAGHRTAWAQAVQLLSRWPTLDQRLEGAPNGPWWLSVRQREVRALRFEPGAIEV